MKAYEVTLMTVGDLMKIAQCQTTVQIDSVRNEKTKYTVKRFCSLAFDTKIWHYAILITMPICIR